jgi:DNA-directed RNA polymerase specialized sigma24 family protein
MQQTKTPLPERPKVQKLKYDVALLRLAGAGDAPAIDKIISSPELWGEVKAFLIFTFHLKHDNLENVVEKTIRKIRRGFLRGKFNLKSCPDGDINAWVKQVAKNAARDYFRHLKTQKSGTQAVHIKYDTVNEFDVAAGASAYYSDTAGGNGDESVASFIEAFDPEHRVDRVAAIYEPEPEADSFSEAQVDAAVKQAPEKQRDRVSTFLKAFELKDRTARAAAIHNGVPEGVYTWYDCLHTTYQAAADIGPGREYVQKSYNPNPYINALRGPQYHINLLLYRGSRLNPIRYDDRPRKSGEQKIKDGALAKRAGHYLNLIDCLMRCFYESGVAETRREKIRNGPNDYWLNNRRVYVRGNWREGRFNGGDGTEADFSVQKKNVAVCKKLRNRVAGYTVRRIGLVFVSTRYDF